VVVVAATSMTTVALPNMIAFPEVAGTLIFTRITIVGDLESPSANDSTKTTATVGHPDAALISSRKTTPSTLPIVL